MKYDIFFQNNGSKEVFQLLGIEDKSDNPYYLTFKDLILPEGIMDGEYTYVVFANTLKEGKCTYEFGGGLMDSLVMVDGKGYSFKDLKPLTGLMRVGEPKTDSNMYKKNNESKGYYYYDKK